MQTTLFVFSRGLGRGAVLPGRIIFRESKGRSFGGMKCEQLQCPDSMEPAGLAIGGIALASLFSTCLDLAEYFELSRSFAYDYQLACLKLTVLKSRLDFWGTRLNVRDAGHEKEELRLHWPEEQEVIRCSLLGIKEIFGDAEVLADKYRLVPRKCRRLALSLPFSSSSEHESRHDQVARQPRANKPHRLFIVRRTTTWAIRDKRKFDGLLLDLEFFIASLEKIIPRIAMPDKQGDKQTDKHPQENPTPGNTTPPEQNSRKRRVQVEDRRKGKEKEFHDDATRRKEEDAQSHSEGDEVTESINGDSYHFSDLGGKAKALVGVFDGASEGKTATMKFTVQRVRDEAKVAGGRHTLASMKVFLEH